MIPEYVAAYAAGLHTVAGVNYRRIAYLLKVIGMGDFASAELKAAATAWVVAHVAPEALADIDHTRDQRRRRSKKGTPPGRGPKPAD